MAGLTGAILVLPQGVAFAMIAGMPPIYGLYSAMIAPIIAGLFGSSKHMITGPATAISIVIFSAMTKMGLVPASGEFISMVFVMTFITGALQIAMGLSRMGSAVNFVSHTVVIGFTAGASILIATSQFKHAFGLPIPTGSTFYEVIIETIRGLGSIHWPTFIVAFSTLGIAIILRAISRKIPHYLIAMIGGSTIAVALGGETAGINMLEEIPGNLPPFEVPDLSFSKIADLSSKAFALALLGLIEAAAIGRSIATQSGQRLNSNQEFIGQGLSNLIGSFFNCFAGSGSFTRSGANYQAGAKTPLAGMFAAVLLMLIVLFIAPWTVYLPIPAMAGVIFMVAYNLIDFKHIREIFKTSGREAAVLAITFTSTLFLDLEFAIYSGVILSLVLYLRITSRPRIVILGLKEVSGNKHLINVKRKKNVKEIDGIRIIRIDGSLFFGSVEHVTERIHQITARGPQKLLIDGSGINLVDLAGAEMLVSEAQRLRNNGGDLYLCNLKRRSREYMTRGEYRKEIGSENFFETEWQAIDAITASRTDA